MTPSHDRRRWFKYLAKMGYYEKSVKRKILISAGEWSEIQNRVVYEISCERVKITGKDAFELIGYNPGDNPWRLHGFIRLATCKQYYPEYGSSGIPHETRSRFAKYFANTMNQGHAKWEEKKRLLAHEKWRKSQLDKWMSESQLRDSIVAAKNQILSYNREEKARIAREATAARKQEYRDRMNKKREMESRIRKTQKSSSTFFQMLAAAGQISEALNQQTQKTA